MQKTQQRNFINSETMQGVISGYISTYGNVDIENEIVVKGAFEKTLATWGSGKKIKIDLSHSSEKSLPIAQRSPSIIFSDNFLELTSDDVGLYGVFKINDIARNAYTKEVEKVVKSYNDGNLKFSIAGFVEQSFIQNGIKYITEYTITSVALVPNGKAVNKNANVLNIKSMSANEKPIEITGIKTATMFLKEYGISNNKAKKIFKALGITHNKEDNAKEKTLDIKSQDILNKSDVSYVANVIEEGHPQNAQPIIPAMLSGNSINYAKVAELLNKK